MKKVRAMLKPVSFFMAIFMIVIFTPYQTVLAKMVTAETLLDAGRVQDARNYVNTMMSRDDVTAALVSQGIDVHEAVARMHALSDTEIVSLADRMESLPAGGSSLGVIVAASVVIFIILLVTDILGYTDLFPFVKKRRI
jgi:hypothetical protein